MTTNSQEQSRKRRFLNAVHLIISHHEPPFMNRCWHFTVRGHTLHVCARCSALLIGIIAAFTFQFYILYVAVTPLTFSLAFLISLPAAIDWSTQTLVFRESRNSIRALTGFLLGYAVGFSLSSLNLIYYLLVVLLYCGFTLGLGALAPFIIRRFRKDQTPSSSDEELLPEPMLQSNSKDH
jgi:uncharacterized membrane protein